MPTANDVTGFLFSMAPKEMKMDFDNVGFLVGRGDRDTSRILVSLDITNDVISEALEIGAGIIVSHHPLFFTLQSVTDSDAVGSKVVRLLEGSISAICMHTNLDAARGGVNDALAAAAGIAGRGSGAELISEEGRLASGEVFSYGRVGVLETPTGFLEYLGMLKAALNADGLRFHDAGHDVHKVAVVGGSGGDMLDHAIRHGCDTFVTADIKYDAFLKARERGMNLIDAGHFCTENVVTKVLAEKLQVEYPDADVYVSQRHGQVVRFC